MSMPWDGMASMVFQLSLETLVNRLDQAGIVC